MITIKTPCIVYASDYHEFYDIHETLKSISSTKGILYKEFEATYAPNRDPYAAVFFVKGEANLANKMIDAHSSKEVMEKL